LLIPYYFSCGQTQECCKSRKVSFHVHVCILSGRISKRPGWCHFTSRQRNALCSRVANNNIKLFRTRARRRGGRKAVENCVSFFPFSQIKPKINMAAARVQQSLLWLWRGALCSGLVFPPPPPVYYCVRLVKILSRWPLKSGANYVRYINSGVFSVAELVFC
jgi:hypothetical protein